MRICFPAKFFLKNTMKLEFFTEQVLSVIKFSCELNSSWEGEKHLVQKFDFNKEFFPSNYYIVIVYDRFLLIGAGH